MLDHTDLAARLRDPDLLRDRLGDLPDHAAQLVHKAARQGRTAVLVAIDDRVAGGLVLADTLKPSATDAVRLKRGSTTTSLALRCFFASITHLKPHGCASAGLPPMTKTKSAFLMSTQWLVIAPRPNVGARLATVGACQMRAWVSRVTTPRPRRTLCVR